MVIEVPQNEEISGGEKESVLPSVGEEQIGGHTHKEMIARKSY